VGEYLKKLLSGIEEERSNHKQKLDELQVKLEKEANKSNSPSVLELSNNIKMIGEEYVQVGVKAGGHIPLVEQIGALCGLGGALYHGTAAIGVHLTQKAMDDGKEVYKDTIEIGGHIAEKYMEEGSEVYKVTLKSGTELAINAGTGTVDLLKRSMDSGDEALKELKDFTEEMAKLGVGEFDNLIKITSDNIEN